MAAPGALKPAQWLSGLPRFSQVVLGNPQTARLRDSVYVTAPWCPLKTNTLPISKVPPTPCLLLLLVSQAFLPGKGI